MDAVLTPRRRRRLFIICFICAGSMNFVLLAPSPIASGSAHAPGRLYRPLLSASTPADCRLAILRLAVIDGRRSAGNAEIELFGVEAQAVARGRL